MTEPPRVCSASPALQQATSLKLRVPRSIMSVPIDFFQRAEEALSHDLRMLREVRNWRYSGAAIAMLSAALRRPTVQQGPPSFRTIAQGELTADQLRTFLPRPHPLMPDLSLTRTEIHDLIAYIEALR